MKQYYYIVGDDKIGPFNLDQLLREDIGSTTLIWSTGMTEWKIASEIPELTNVLVQKPPPIPSSVMPPIPSEAILEPLPEFSRDDSHHKTNDEVNFVTRDSTTLIDEKLRNVTKPQYDQKYESIGGGFAVVLSIIWILTIITLFIDLVESDILSFVIGLVLASILGYATYQSTLDSPERSDALDTFKYYFIFSALIGIKLVLKDDDPSVQDIATEIIFFDVVVTISFLAYFYLSKRVSRTLNYYGKPEK